ncbi:nuclear transport factor 2 family protein [Salinarchaeum laminariae]|uniref:nuclear transport factor 2 family protein n=1 Tax=Salinarchaeum laminariae TaxID=869888 RepID=UPI0020C150EE|nr:nuclear transport factor 2 family protein [Salinarchaeum laminariae]
MDPATLARTYYEAIDEDEYDRLRELLTAGFTQERSDRTFESREAFVSFMQHDRPDRDTTHEIEHVTATPDRVVVEGTLRRSNGDVWFRFADAFEIEDGQLASLRTYSI